MTSRRQHRRWRCVCHKLAAPSDGYSALLGEAVFNEGSENQFWLSTNVRIVPSKSVSGGQ